MNKDTKALVRKPTPEVRKPAPAIRRIVDDAQKKPRLYVERVKVHGEGE